MFVGVELAAILVAIALGLLTQVVLSIRSDSKQAATIAKLSQSQLNLSRSLNEFTQDTRHRFDVQDEIIRGHGHSLASHGSDIGYLKGRLKYSGETK